MQKIRLSSQPLFLLAIVGAVGVFVGLGIRMVNAAATFTNPGCDPAATSGVNVCSASGPLLLDPADSGTTQVIGSPIQIGTLDAPRITTFYGNMQLMSGKYITTETNTSGESIFAGTAIDVTSTSDNAIQGTSLVSGKSGVYAKGQNAGTGLYASSETGSAIFSTSTTGKAAEFIGDVSISNGDVNIGITGHPSTIFVNGEELNPGSGTTGVKIVNNIIAGNSTTVNVRNDFFPGHNYQVNYIKVMYDNASTIEKTWIPLAPTNVNYSECNPATTYNSELRVTNPSTNTFPVNFRIVIKYTKVDVSCSPTE